MDQQNLPTAVGSRFRSGPQKRRPRPLISQCANAQGPAKLEKPNTTPLVWLPGLETRKGGIAPYSLVESSFGGKDADFEVHHWYRYVFAFHRLCRKGRGAGHI